MVRTFSPDRLFTLTYYRRTRPSLTENAYPVIQRDQNDVLVHQIFGTVESHTAMTGAETPAGNPHHNR